MKLKKFWILVFLIILTSSTFASASIIKNSEIESKNNSEQIVGMNSDVLTPPWSEYAGWCDKWSELFGESKGNANVDAYDGSGYAKAKSRLFGKAQTRTVFYHQTSAQDYTAPSSKKYDFVFTYEYDGFLNFELYHYPWFDLLFEYEIKILFNMYIEGDQDPYVKKITLEKGRYEGAGFEEKDLEGTIDWVFEDIYVAKGKHVTFTAKVDIYLYAATGAFGLIKSEAKINGKLKRVTITDAYSDIQPPIVNLNKPTKAFYIKNVRRCNFPIPFIIGDIDIEADAFDTGSGIEKVEFYINNELKKEDTSEPYIWNWNERKSISSGKIKVIAYDNAGNVQEDSLYPVRYLNPWGE